MTQVKSERSRRRRERVAAAQQWVAAAPERERGDTIKAIAAHFDVKPKTVYGWLADPDGSRARERKLTYRSACPNCGADTSPPAADEEARRCRRCAHPSGWTRDTIVAALRDAERDFGRRPKSTDFNRAHAARRGPDALARYERVGLNQAVIARVFGSWPDAVAAAFDQPAPADVVEISQSPATAARRAA